MLSDFSDPNSNPALVSSHLSMLTSWIQGTTRRSLASVTIADYTGAVGEIGHEIKMRVSRGSSERSLTRCACLMVVTARGSQGQDRDG